MIFDQTWIADLLELQKRATELNKGKNPTNEIQNLVMEVLDKWGINDLPWNGDPGFPNFDRRGTQAEPKAGENLNIDISETKQYVYVQVLIPGIGDKNDLLIKLRGDMLYISGKSSYFEPDGGPFSRKIRLPAEVTPLGAEATYNNNNLTISLPKISADGVIIPLNFSQSG